MTLYLTSRRAKLFLKLLVMYHGLLKGDEKELCLTLIAEIQGDLVRSEFYPNFYREKDRVVREG